jgi:hypothetical protein
MNSDGTQPATAPAGFKVAEVGMPPRPIDQYDAPSLVGKPDDFRLVVGLGAHF